MSCDSKLKTQKSELIKDGMVFIEGGKFLMGGDNDEARSDEYPKHSVEISSFWMDETEVTNAQFKKFIDETGYITTAERKINWDEIKSRDYWMKAPVAAPLNGSTRNNFKKYRTL